MSILRFFCAEEKLKTMKEGRKCSRCGMPLSIYNDRNYCFCHEIDVFFERQDKLTAHIPSRANGRNCKIRDILTKEFLTKEYIDNEKSALTISFEVSMSPWTIRQYLKKFNIKTRPVGKHKKRRTDEL